MAFGAIKVFGAIEACAAITGFEAITDAEAMHKGAVVAVDIKATQTDAKTASMTQRGHAGVAPRMASLHVQTQNQPSNFPSDIAKKTIAMKKQIF
jgi:hypothetical protein